MPIKAPRIFLLNIDEFVLDFPTEEAIVTDKVERVDEEESRS